MAQSKIKIKAKVTGTGTFHYTRETVIAALEKQRAREPSAERDEQIQFLEDVLKREFDGNLS